MPKTPKPKTTPEKSRRNIIVAGAAIASVPVLKQWGKPVVNSIVLPSHAQTSDDTATPPPPSPPPAPVSETFALSLASPNGPLSQGAEFFVAVENGTFTISIYTDGQETDISARITSATASSIGTIVGATFSGCANDGSQGPAFPSPQGIQVVSYTPGVSVELQFEGDTNTFVLPLSPMASAPVCPVL